MFPFNQSIDKLFGGTVEASAAGDGRQHSEFFRSARACLNNLLYNTVPLVSLRALLHIHWTFTIVTWFFIFRMPFQSGTSKKGVHQSAHGARNTCGSTAEAPCGCWATRCHFPGEVSRRAAQKSCDRSCKKLQVFARNTDTIWYIYYIIYDITWLVVLMVRICSKALAVLVTSSRKHNPWFGMFWQNDSPSRNGVSWGWKSCCSNGGINSSWPWPKGCFMLPPCSATCFFFFNGGAFGGFDLNFHDYCGYHYSILFWSSCLESGIGILDGTWWYHLNPLNFKSWWPHIDSTIKHVEWEESSSQKASLSNFGIRIIWP